MTQPDHSLVVTANPTAEPLRLAEVKTFLRVDSSDEDDFVLMLIRAAREYCEGVTKRVFTTTTMRMFMDDWPDGDVLELPRPFDSSTATPTVKYYASGSTSATTFAATKYWVDNDTKPGRIVLRNNQEWPTTELRSVKAVEVTLQTGFGGQGDVPDNIKLAMLQLIGHWYNNREAVVVGTITNSLEMSVNALLSRHVVPFFP